jgi:hypothetical protein
MDPGDDIFAVDDNLLVLWRAQGDVEYSAILRDIDLVAAEHGLDLCLQTRLLRQLHQQFQRLVGHAVL